MQIATRGEKIGVIGSPNKTTQFKIDILEGSIDNPLKGKLFAFMHEEGGKEKVVITQLTDIEGSNPWHEKKVLKSVIKKRGKLDNLSGETDIKEAELELKGVFEVSNGDFDRSTMNTPPSSGTPIHEATTDLIDKITEGKQGIFKVGHIFGSETVAPLQLKHFGPAPGGFGEARRIGIFGKSGTGKSVIGASMIGGFAQNKEMGILILDPQGEFSDDRFGEDSTFDFSFHKLLNATRGDFEKLDINDIALDNQWSFLSLLKRVDFFDRLMYKSSKKVDSLIDVIGNRMKSDSMTPNDVSVDYLAKIAIGQADIIYSSDREDQVRDAYETNPQYLQKIFQEVQELFDPTSRTPVGNLCTRVLHDNEVIILNINPRSLNTNFSMDQYAKHSLLYGVISSFKKSAGRRFHAGNKSNALIALDEAHNYIPEGEPNNSTARHLKNEISKAQLESRKWGIGWMFINQRTSDFDKTAYSQLGDYVFCHGLGIGADETNVKGILGKSMFEEYKQLPEPKQSNIYSYVVTGGLGSIGTRGAPLIIRGFDSIDDLLKENNLTN